MPLEGMDSVLQNLASLKQRLREAAASASEEIAALLEAYAKTNAPFTDQTGNLRQSISGSAQQTAKDVYTIILAAGMNYGMFVELLHEQKYAFLWPAVSENTARIQQIWAERIGAVMNG